MEASKSNMKSVIYTHPAIYKYSATDKQIPTPQKGQVLIKVECAPINPSDIYFLSGKYNGNYTCPLTPGGEGSGTVISSGGGLYAWSLVGKRVAFARKAERAGNFSIGGSFAEYCVTDAYQCIALDNSTSFEQGACAILNPLTAIGLLAKCKEYKARAVIQTGAASQLGRMMIQLLRDNNLPLINIVRREEQVKMLMEEYKCEYVLNSESEDFMIKFKDVSKQLGANVALDCVAGPIVGQIGEAIQNKGVIISYGLLSEQKISGLSPMHLMGKNLTLEGFLLPYWLKNLSYWSLSGVMKQSKQLLGEVKIQKEYGLHQIKEAIEDYKKDMTKGKILLKPSLTITEELENKHNNEQNTNQHH